MYAFFSFVLSARLEEEMDQSRVLCAFQDAGAYHSFRTGGFLHFDARSCIAAVSSDCVVGLLAV